MFERPRRRVAGFTLIELMIAVAVIAILAGIAFPSFMGAIRKSRRAEAFQALNAVQQAQERHRSNNASYTTNLTAAPSASAPGLGLGATSSPGGYYSLSLSGATGAGYTAVATAVSGKSQAQDGICAKLGVRMNAGNLLYTSGNTTTADGDLTWAATNACWSR